MINLLDELNHYLHQTMAFDGDLTEADDLGEAVGMDSLDATDMRLHFEEILQKEIPDSADDKFMGNVGELMVYLHAL